MNRNKESNFCDPAKLTDEEWTEKFAQLKQIRKMEAGKG